MSTKTPVSLKKRIFLLFLVILIIKKKFKSGIVDFPFVHLDSESPHRRHFMDVPDHPYCPWGMIICVSSWNCISVVFSLSPRLSQYLEMCVYLLVCLSVCLCKTHLKSNKKCLNKIGSMHMKLSNTNLFSLIGAHTCAIWLF